MMDLGIVFLILVIFSIYIFGIYIDKRYNLRVIDWLNGSCSTPFSNNKIASQQSLEKTTEIKALKARIETLEKIVTEPAFELNQKINALK